MRLDNDEQKWSWNSLSSWFNSSPKAKYCHTYLTQKHPHDKFTYPFSSYGCIFFEPSRFTAGHRILLTHGIAQYMVRRMTFSSHNAFIHAICLHAYRELRLDCEYLKEGSVLWNDQSVCLSICSYPQIGDVTDVSVSGISEHRGSQFTKVFGEAIRWDYRNIRCILGCIFQIACWHLLKNVDTSMTSKLGGLYLTCLM